MLLPRKNVLAVPVKYQFNHQHKISKNYSNKTKRTVKINFIDGSRKYNQFEDQQAV